MQPASQNDPPNAEDRNGTTSRPVSIARRSSENNNRTVDAIETIAANEEKKETIGEVKLRDADGPDDDRPNAVVDEEIEYPSGLKLILLTIGLCLVIFVVSVLQFMLGAFG